jgi:biotin carboxyl carrier protein
MLLIAKRVFQVGGLLALSAIALTSVAQAQEVAEAPVAECVAKVQPEKISSQEEPVSLRAVYSESIGKVLSALIEEGSGIKVVEVVSTASTPAAEPVVTVQLDLSKAIAGEWTLSFQGESGKCTAKVTVQAAEDPSR